MTTSDNELAPPEPTSPPPHVVRRNLLRALLPHFMTACFAVALTLAIIGLWMRPAPAVSFPPTAVPQAVAPLPTATAAPTPVLLPQSVARQEVADLRAEADRLWSTVYVLKALSQVANAEAALRRNDMSGVDQSLIAVDYSLSLAYARAEDAQKSPINQFRRNVDRLHADLYLYPDQIDTQLAQLRQFLLTLIDEPK